MMLEVRDRLVGDAKWPRPLRVRGHRDEEGQTRNFQGPLGTVRQGG